MIDRAHQVLIGLLIAGMCSACGLLDSGGDIPAFIHVEEASLSTTSDQGASTSAITDLWVFIDNEGLGGYQLPSTMPILPNGDESNLLFLAGIRVNGISASPAINPFYEGIELRRNLVPGTRDTLALIFTYKTETVFELIEDFEGNHSFTVDRDGDAETHMAPTTESASSGLRSGVIRVTDENRSAKVATSFLFDAANVGGGAVFVEMDYKNEIDLQVGLVGVSGSNSFENPKLGLRPSGSWKKVYIDFTEDIAASGLDSYRILLLVTYSGTDIGEQRVFVDNVKLIHF